VKEEKVLLTYIAGFPSSSATIFDPAFRPLGCLAIRHFHNVFVTRGSNTLRRMPRISCGIAGTVVMVASHVVVITFIIEPTFVCPVWLPRPLFHRGPCFDCSQHMGHCKVSCRNCMEMSERTIWLPRKVVVSHTIHLGVRTRCRVLYPLQDVGDPPPPIFHDFMIAVLSDDQLL
jgi:hypothetical protein